MLFLFSLILVTSPAGPPPSACDLHLGSMFTQIQIGSSDLKASEKKWETYFGFPLEDVFTGQKREAKFNLGLALQFVAKAKLNQKQAAQLFTLLGVIIRRKSIFDWNMRSFLLESPDGKHRYIVFQGHKHIERGNLVPTVFILDTPGDIYMGWADEMNGSSKMHHSELHIKIDPGFEDFDFKP